MNFFQHGIQWFTLQETNFLNIINYGEAQEEHFILHFFSKKSLSIPHRAHINLNWLLARKSQVKRLQKQLEFEERTNLNYLLKEPYLNPESQVLAPVATSWLLKQDFEIFRSS